MCIYYVIIYFLYTKECYSLSSEPAAWYKLEDEIAHGARTLFAAHQRHAQVLEEAINRPGIHLGSQKSRLFGHENHEKPPKTGRNRWISWRFRLGHRTTAPLCSRRSIQNSRRQKFSSTAGCCCLEIAISRRRQAIFG